jgi:hypothetical protein
MKTLYKNLIGLSVLAGMLLAPACTGDFEEINTDPNQPSSVSTAFLLTAAQRGLMDNTWDEWFNGRRGNQLAQYWASNQYSSESRYQFRDAVSNSYWSLFYSGSSVNAARPGGGMSDLEEIIRLNTEKPSDYVGFGDNGNQIAVAKALKAWTFQNLTDCWGPIPFSDALKGSDSPSPEYDSQEAVYNGLIAMLNEANNDINLSGDGPQGDKIYNGDMNKWKKFINSLKMRVAIRMADVNSAAASQAINEALADGVFESNSDNALLVYGSAAPGNNPLNEDRKTRNDFASSHTMVNTLLDINDPRIGEYYEPAVASGQFVGEIYGLTEEDAAITPDESISQRNAQILAPDAPGIYLDYAQILFTLAEAVERGYITGNAASYYNEGIQASMEFWGITDAGAIANYIAQPEVDYDALKAAGATWREIIGKQKWIALYMQGIQGWSEWRRLDFGILEMPAGGVLAGTGIPLRMTYPLDEQTLNGANYEQALQLLGGPDALDTRLWWDVN